MSWLLFFAVAACFVATLIVLDNWEHLRARFLSRPAKTSRRSSSTQASTSPSGADEFVRQAADVTGTGAAVSGIGSATANASGSGATAHYAGNPGVMSMRRTSPSSDVHKPAKRVHWGRALGEFAALLWRWKLPLLALALFIAGVGVLRSCSAFEFTKSKDTLRAERDAALIDKTVAEHEADMGRTAVELAEETHQDRERVRVVIDRAEEEIADAVSQADFDRLHDAYSRAYGLVWASGGSEDRPDPVAPGAEGVRGAPGHTV